MSGDALGAGRPVLVLLVEDNAALRRATSLLLRSLGFAVCVAANATEACAMAAEQTGIGLVMTDIHLPGVDGHVLAGRLAATHPGLPVMFVTGRAPQPEAGRVVLLKPFTAAQLMAAIEAAVGAAPSL